MEEQGRLIETSTTVSTISHLDSPSESISDTTSAGGSVLATTPHSVDSIQSANDSLASNSKSTESPVLNVSTTDAIVDNTATSAINADTTSDKIDITPDLDLTTKSSSTNESNSDIIKTTASAIPDDIRSNTTTVASEITVSDSIGQNGTTFSTTIDASTAKSDVIDPSDNVHTEGSGDVTDTTDDFTISFSTSTTSQTHNSTAIEGSNDTIAVASPSSVNATSTTVSTLASNNTSAVATPTSVNDTSTASPTISTTAPATKQSTSDPLPSLSASTTTVSVALTNATAVANGNESIVNATGSTPPSATSTISTVGATNGTSTVESRTEKTTSSTAFVPTYSSTTSTLASTALPELSSTEADTSTDNDIPTPEEESHEFTTDSLTDVKTTIATNPRHTTTEEVLPEPNDKTTREPIDTDDHDTGDRGTPEPDEHDGIKPEPGNGTSEPEDDVGNEPESEAGPEFNLEAFAEPGPDWELAKELWQEAWEFHVYFFGLCFVLLGMYCVFGVIRLWTMEHLLSRNYFVTLHLLVILVCILRATYLLIDAYNSTGRFPTVMDYFLYSTVFPCITALFSILFYALLLATRVRVLSQKVQRLSVLLVIISLHFVLSIVTDITVGIFATAPVLIFVCQTVFIVWGLLMFIGYLVIFRKLYKGAINRQKVIQSTSPDRLHSSNPAMYNEKTGKFKYTFDLAVKITFASAFFGVAIVGFELYGMFGVYGVLKAGRKPEPWPWWTYHFIVRSLEILMCSSVAYVASQPLRYSARKDRGKMYPYFLPCSKCFCNEKLDHSYESSSISMEFVSDHDHLGWLKKIRNKKPIISNAPYPPHAAEKYTDPDATLLVRKIRQPKPSMLVVEGGFVRIRRDDEILPSNHFEMDSRSSHSSGLNLGDAEQPHTGALINWNYTGDADSASDQRLGHVNSFSLDNYIIPRIEDERSSIDNVPAPDENADDTDVDIVVTDVEDDADASEGGRPESPRSTRSGDIFRPLSMIDLAASMESELDRAFQGGIDSADIISHNSLPVSLEGVSDSSQDAYNEPMFEQYYGDGYFVPDPDALNHSGANHMDYDSDQSRASSNSRLLHSPVRRCRSEEKPRPRSKTFDSYRYHSLSSVESVGKQDESCEFDYRSKDKL
ncbi:PRRT3-like protein [Mya arenaria]|uniref:PRRT3-like protein n=1 Tax=Mya arenaria TaxID=6604 RepID=A0ABY7FYA6_MYAAR|nr:PRRT3-like protein [Mya arenaria]